MNLQAQLRWAERTLNVLRQPAHARGWVSPERLQEKLGWLNDYADVVSEWLSWQQVVHLAVDYVNRHGVSRRAAVELAQAMPPTFDHASTQALAKDLIGFVAEQGEQTKVGERFPGSTEVLESCFGKMKALEKQQSRGGFTSLLVSFGAMLASLTRRTIQTAWKHNTIKDVYRWCKENLGTTVFGKRKLAFAQGAMKTG